VGAPHDPDRATVAIYLHTTTAFVLSMNKSRELWNSAVMVPIFLTSATASGIALLLICAYIMQRFEVLKFTTSMFRSLSTLLATVIIIDLFLLLVEILTIYWPTSAKPGHTVRFRRVPFWRVRQFFIPVLILGITAFACSQGAKASPAGDPDHGVGALRPSRSSSSAIRSCPWGSRSTRSDSTLRPMSRGLLRC